MSVSLWLCEAVLSLTAEQWKQMAIKPSFHVLKKDEVMCVPVGYILAE